MAAGRGSYGHVSPVENRKFTRIQAGEVAGTTTAGGVQLPSIACALVWIKAQSANTGNVYLGVSGITVPNGVTDATSGYPLAAKDSIGPLYVDNLSDIYIICDHATDNISYLALGPD